MSRDIFIGIDGGASKCKVRIEDADGELLGVEKGGPSNIRLSVDKTWETIYQTIESILAHHHLALQDPAIRFHAGMGLAGCEVEEARVDFLNRQHPFTTLKLVSDAHVACLGAHSGRDGAIIIIGTGVIGYQIAHGVESRVGGWGFPHDDEGGGAWLGLEAMRLTFQSLDKRCEMSPLLQDILAFFESDVAYMTTWANKANSSEFARIAPLVIKHSQTGEPLAINLMRTAAKAVDLVGAALEKLAHRVPCSLFGGIAPFLEPYLGEALRARLQAREGDANTGAILLIKNNVTA